MHHEPLTKYGLFRESMEFACMAKKMRKKISLIEKNFKREFHQNQLLIRYS